MELHWAASYTSLSAHPSHKVINSLGAASWWWKRKGRVWNVQAWGETADFIYQVAWSKNIGTKLNSLKEIVESGEVLTSAVRWAGLWGSWTSTEINHKPRASSICLPNAGFTGTRVMSIDSGLMKMHQIDSRKRAIKTRSVNPTKVRLSVTKRRGSLGARGREWDGLHLKLHMQTNDLQQYARITTRVRSPKNTPTSSPHWNSHTSRNAPGLCWNRLRMALLRRQHGHSKSTWI